MAKAVGFVAENAVAVPADEAASVATAEETEDEGNAS
jgi:hypothetical protein